MQRLDARRIAGDNVVDESLRVRSLHADLPFHGHVPHGDVMGQRFMLGRRAAVLGAHVTARVVLEMRPSSPACKTAPEGPSEPRAMSSGSR